MHSRTMPRFYFHLRNDMNVDDPEGKELPDLDEAIRCARVYAIDMAAASIVEHHKLNGTHRIEVADQSGEIVCAVRFGDVVKIEA